MERQPGNSNPDNSDSCIMSTGLALKTEGITGFVIQNAGLTSTLSIEHLRCYVINPQRQTITFCLENYGQPFYKTYSIPKISEIIIVSGEKIHAVEEAEKFLKQR